MCGGVMCVCGGVMCVCVCVGGGGGRVPSISFLLLQMLDTSNYCFPLKYARYTQVRY